MAAALVGEKRELKRLLEAGRAINNHYKLLISSNTSNFK